MQSSRGPTLPDPEDKPPSYEQILKLDGLPPDYYSVLSEKPPRYDACHALPPWLMLLITANVSVVMKITILLKVTFLIINVLF